MVTAPSAVSDFFFTDELAIDEPIKCRSSMDDKSFEGTKLTISKHSGVQLSFTGWSEDKQMLNKKLMVLLGVIIMTSPMLVPLSRYSRGRLSYGLGHIQDNCDLLAGVVKCTLHLQPLTLRGCLQIGCTNCGFKQ